MFLAQLRQWFRVNGLKLNEDKTQLIRFCTPQLRQLISNEIEFEDIKLPILKHAKFLGLEIDMNLNWYKCIETISKRLNSACFQMLVLRDIVDLKTRIMIYYAYFHPILQYGIELWGFSSDTDKVLITQKKMLRIMTFAPWNSSCKKIYTELKIMTVPSLVILKTLLFVQTNYEKLFSENFMHEYNTRFKSNFQYPRHRLKLVERTPSYMGKRFFNKLPDNIKSLINTNKFRSSLTNLLLEKNYYKISEFLNDSL